MYECAGNHRCMSHYILHIGTSHRWLTSRQSSGCQIGINRTGLARFGTHTLIIYCCRYMSASRDCFYLVPIWPIFWPNLTPLRKTEKTTEGCQSWWQIGTDWLQMGQIWDFLRSVSVRFGSAAKPY